MSLVRKEYAEIFSLFDTVGDDKVYVKHLGDIIRSCGQNPTASLLSKCTEEYGQDDRISFDEFVPILNAVEKKALAPRPEEIVEVFREFDRQGNGFMHAAELKRILTSVGDRLTEDEACQIIEGMENSYGNVNYEEFVKTVHFG